MNRPSYKELWLYEHKDRDEQLEWIRNAVNGNAKFCNSEPPYSEEEELARKIMQMHARIAELKAVIDQLIAIGGWAITGMTIATSYSPGEMQNLAEKKSDDWYALIKNLKECDKEKEREE